MINKIFSSLSVKAYRIYFVGLIFANLGSWMSSTAKTWLLIDTLAPGNATAMGILWCFNFGPALVLAPVAGSVADRFPKRKIMLYTQGVVIVNAMSLTYLVIVGQAQLWMLQIFALLDGCMMAIASPAFQAFVSEIVPRNMIPNAVSINSASFNAARLLGPGIAGALIAALGTGTTLAINLFGPFVFITVIILIKQEWIHPSPISQNKGQIREGLQYVKYRPDLLLLIFMGFMMGNFGFNFAISNSLMARNEFGIGSQEFGALGSFMGVGALAAAILSARRPKPRLRYVFAGTILFSVFTSLAALAPNYITFALLQIPVGIFAVQTMVVANSLLQVRVEDRFRGRVITIWTSITIGGSLFAAPLCGWLGEKFGPRATVWYEAVALVIASIIGYLWVSSYAQVKVRFDRHKHPYHIRLVRGQISEEVQTPTVNFR